MLSCVTRYHLTLVRLCIPLVHSHSSCPIALLIQPTTSLFPPLVLFDVMEITLLKSHVAGVDMAQVEGDVARITELITSTQCYSVTGNYSTTTTFLIYVTPSTGNNEPSSSGSMILTSSGSGFMAPSIPVEPWHRVPVDL